MIATLVLREGDKQGVSIAFRVEGKAANTEILYKGIECGGMEATMAWAYQL